MPTSEQAFRRGEQDEPQSLQDAVSRRLVRSAAPLSAAVLSAWVLEKCTLHLRQAQHVKNDVQQQQFWLQHQQLDNMISRTLMSLPEQLRAATTREPLALFVSMCLHEFTISLFQAAILLAHKSPSKLDSVAGLRSRARRAAEEIIDIVRSKASMDIRRMSTFTPSCLYVAATVYINDLSSGFEVEHAREALLFILHTIKLFREHVSISFPC